MATLLINKARVNGLQDTDVNILTSSDDLPWNPLYSTVAEFTNGTGGTVNITIVGDQAPTNYQCAGTGMTEDLSGGFVVTLADGETKYLDLASIRAYLAGAVTVDSDVAGAEAVFYQFSA